MLGLYKRWGFPEVWVEVPDRRPPSHQRNRRPGLTIHLREGGIYREVEESRAFPGWKAGEIHAAMNEKIPSAETYAVLARVGLAMGAREGTGPDDHPLSRSLRRRAREEGLAEGRAKGAMEDQADMLRLILRLRGITVSDGFPADIPGFAEWPMDATVAAALACESEADFLDRIRRH